MGTSDLEVAKFELDAAAERLDEQLERALERIEQVLRREKDVVGAAPDALPQGGCRQRGFGGLALEEQEAQLDGEAHAAEVALTLELLLDLWLRVLSRKDVLAVLLAQPRDARRLGQPSHHGLHRLLCCVPGKRRKLLCQLLQKRS